MNILDWKQFAELANRAMIARNELANAVMRNQINSHMSNGYGEPFKSTEKAIYETAANADMMLSRVLSELGKLVTTANAEHQKPQLTCPYCGEKVDIYGELHEGDSKESDTGICCQKCGKFCMIVFKLEKAKELEK